MSADQTKCRFCGEPNETFRQACRKCGNALPERTTQIYPAPMIPVPPPDIPRVFGQVIRQPQAWVGLLLMVAGVLIFWSFFPFFAGRTPSINQPSPDLQLVESEIRGHHIVGTVRNNSDRTISYAQVQFNVYDSNDVQVGSTMSNVNNLEPHSDWRFNAYIMEEHFDHVTFQGCSGF